MPATNAQVTRAPRCQHVTLDGNPCAQPAIRGRDACRLHFNPDAKPLPFSLPIIEDAAGLQRALTHVIRALANDQIETRKASLILYALQIASMNLRRLARERSQEQQPEEEKAQGPSLAQILLDKLQIETDEQAAERRAREHAEDALRQNGWSSTQPPDGQMPSANGQLPSARMTKSPAGDE